MAEKPVHEQVQDLLNSWNKPPEDHSLERIVGVPTGEADTAATAHVPMEELNKGFRDDGDDDSGGDTYEDMTIAELKEEIDSRNADRDEEDHLSKTGNKAELIERLEADDEE